MCQKCSEKYLTLSLNSSLCRIVWKKIHPTMFLFVKCQSVTFKMFELATLLNTFYNSVFDQI